MSDPWIRTSAQAVAASRRILAQAKQAAFDRRRALPFSRDRGTSRDRPWKDRLACREFQQERVDYGYQDDPDDGGAQ